MRNKLYTQQYFDYSKSVGGVDNCPGCKWWWNYIQ